jgi:hypothetical protein
MENLLNNPIISVALSLAIISYIIYRQIRPRKISKKGLIIFPLIILFFIIQTFPTFHPTATKLFEIITSSIASITLGLLACRQLHVYKGPTGKAMAKGSWTYFLWWLGTFIVKSLLSILFGETNFQSINQIEIFLPVFFLITTRNAYLYWKTTKLGLDLH